MTWESSSNPTAASLSSYGAYGFDDTCLTDTVKAVELAVDLMLEYPEAAE